MSVKEYNKILLKFGIYSADYIRPSMSKNSKKINAEKDFGLFVRWREIPFSALCLDLNNKGISLENYRDSDYAPRGGKKSVNPFETYYPIVY